MERDQVIGLLGGILVLLMVLGLVDHRHNSAIEKNKDLEEEIVRRGTVSITSLIR